ncbi:MAG: hypothetical protein U1E65_08435 [Myxococcota bacterium]
MRAGRAIAALLVAGIGLAPLRPVHAAPDPTIATVLSAASTVVPLAVTVALWTPAPGVGEDVRFNMGMTFIGIGSILGPSVGQIYAEAGGDAVVSFILRSITATVMLVGSGYWARSEEHRGLGQALTIVGGVPTALLALYDIFGASSSAIAAAAQSGHGVSGSEEVPLRYELSTSLRLCMAGVGPCSAVGPRP